jgi:7,8-dihydropterin-6-yl-methyl-4-(beta-D-ribofuranosyl)aminobenzene 5'-phosphate synthase
MALWFRTGKGLVIVTGCCHSGLINTIIHCKKISGCNSVQAVIGGFHLVNAPENRLEQTCKKLEEYSVKKIYPFHCTGEKSVNYLKSHSTIEVIQGYTGKIINFEL